MYSTAVLQPLPTFDDIGKFDSLKPFNRIEMVLAPKTNQDKVDSFVFSASGICIRYQYQDADFEFSSDLNGKEEK